MTPDTVLVESWACALDPSEETFQKIKPLIQGSYGYVKERSHAY